MRSSPSDEPVNVEVYIDYRDHTVDNYPNIDLYDDCAEELRPDVDHVYTHNPEEEAECERCGRRNAAAMRSSG